MLSGALATATPASPFVWAGVVSVFAGLLIAAVAWHQRGARGARTYAVLMVVVSVWSALYVLQLLQPSVEGKQVPFVVRHAITPLISALFWLFAAEFTDRGDILSRRFAVPIILTGGVLTVMPLVNPADLYYTGLSLYTVSSPPRLAISFGPVFWLMTLYVAVVVGGGHIYLVDKLLDSFSIYRRQLNAMAVVGSIEFGLMLVFLSEHVGAVPDLNPWPHVQLITYNMVFVAAPLGWSYLRQSLFDIQILDRQDVIENMEDAVFVFDTDDVLRNVNDPGVALTEADDPGGKTAADVFASSPILLEAYRRGGEQPIWDGAGSRQTASTAPAGPSMDEVETAIANSDSAERGDSVELVVDGDRRWYDIRVSTIENSLGEQTGTVVVARDVTEQRRRQQTLSERTEELRRKTQRLQRQNERLDRFAGVVSHDLRNPLMVLSTHLDLVGEDVPEENVRAMEQSLDRMEAMIDDLLTMARAGQTVESTEPVALVDTVRAAWHHARTDGCELRAGVPVDVTVQADRDRLLHVFENLFRNAVDHNEPPLTVAVGLLDERSGFFVEDDGSGIPADERADVFEHGYTTSDDGTGLGLSIVQDMVESHGWEIDLAESADGGARFEITGVEFGR